jgi:Rrf2 family protein
MRLTNEADYALRICYTLAKLGGVASSKELADKTGVTLRFALKILRKLALAGVVASQKGASGGYYLNRPADEVSVGEVVEVIDGPFRINLCLDPAFECSRDCSEEDGGCKFNRYFKDLNRRIREDMYAMRLSAGEGPDFGKRRLDNDG